MGVNPRRTCDRSRSAVLRVTERYNLLSQGAGGGPCLVDNLIHLKMHGAKVGRNGAPLRLIALERAVDEISEAHV